ncbi:MAG: DNA polymerase III subunit chi [Deltaproteobacteria bacterium]|nr:MAG: DNA polymerase III subunit chi [Deltaproteobacteria bacterium]
MPHVEFVKLERPEKARVLCELAEEFHLLGHRVLVVVEDDNKGVTLDEFMWTWKKSSFVPHVYDNGTVECLDEPVVIAIREENANGAGVLIAGRPCSMEFARQFQVVIDFAEVYDEALREASRTRFRAYRETGFAPVMR